MPNDIDTGDSSVFIVFQGKFLLTPVGGTFSTNVLMLGNTDIVLFQSDVTNLTNAGHVCNLPEQCRPKKNVQSFCGATTNKGRKIAVPITIYSSGEVIFEDINSEETKHAKMKIPAHECKLYLIDDVSMDVSSNVSLSVSTSGSTTITKGSGGITEDIPITINSTGTASGTASGTATLPKVIPVQVTEYEIETDIQFTDDEERVEVLHLNGFTFNICDRWYESETGATV